MRRAARPGKRSKYGVRTDAAGKAARTIDGILFASMKEARRYGQLKLLEKAGAITDLELQPKFDLRVYHFMQEHPLTVARYTADFRYWDKRNQTSVVEDAKGAKTEAYKLRKKIVEANYCIQIKEV